MKKIEFFKVEGDRISRVRKYCPKCGPAVFLGEHKDRFSCGKCGYTEFKGGGRPSKPATDEKKPLEAKAETQAEPPAPEPPIEQAPPSVEEGPDESSTEAISTEAPDEKPAEDIQKDEESSETKQKDDKATEESSDEDKKE